MGKWFATGMTLGAGICLALGALGPARAAGAPLATAQVRAAGEPAAQAFDGVVEAVRSSIVAAQVAGAIVALDVKAGERVRAGQVLLRIDARAAEQTASAGDAQLRSAQAMLELATQDFQRQKQLFDKQYISQAALERAESQFKAAQAQAAALRAQAGAARTQSGLHVLRAPFAGIVADVPVTLGDMALPGKPLLTLYEPGALRVTAAMPQSLRGAPADGLKLEFPGLLPAQRWVTPAATQLQWLPTADPATHTAQLRAALPAAAVNAGLAPGAFARVWLPLRGDDKAARLYVPASAVVRRAEMTGVYVVDEKGVARLRQVRLGRGQGPDVEVLAGVSAGERVAVDPQAAARAD